MTGVRRRTCVATSTSSRITTTQSACSSTDVRHIAVYIASRKRSIVDGKKLRATLRGEFEHTRNTPGTARTVKTAPRSFERPKHPLACTYLGPGGRRGSVTLRSGIRRLRRVQTRVATYSVIIITITFFNNLYVYCVGLCSTYAFYSSDCVLGS